MGKYKKNRDRREEKELPSRVEEYVSEENEVRVIDYYVDSLDIERLGIKRARETKMGAPTYDPRDLIKLYIYGYINKIRSSRRLMQEARRNIEVMWLINELKPDFRTISDFRKDNIEGLKGIYRDFNRMCIKLNLFSNELISQDGSKFKAVNSKAKNYTLNKIDDAIKRLDKKAEEYIESIGASEEEERIKIEVNIKEVKGRMAKYRKMQEKMEKEGIRQISETDEDSRLMKCNGNMLVGYNVQTIVEGKNKLICNYEVTNACNDNGLMGKIGEETKEILGVERIEQLADGGYKNKEDIKYCLEHKIIPVLPEGKYEIEYEYEEGKVSEEEKEGRRAKDIRKCFKAGIKPECYKDLDIEVKVVEKEIRKGEEKESPYKSAEEMKERAKEGYFVRDKERNIVYCKEGEELRHKSFNSGKERYCNKLACRRCKNKCCEAQYKTVDFNEWEYEKSLKRVAPRGKVIGKKKIVKVIYRPDKEKYKKRKELSEHPFGTVKRAMGSDYLLLKGKKKVSGEMALTFLAYNFKRVIKIFGVKNLIENMKKVQKEWIVSGQLA